MKANQPAIFDLYADANILALAQYFTNTNKTLTAVCHGPTVFLKATAPTGEASFSLLR